ncbi:MAG: antibiotic biosynthesis monooxygenase [Desulfobacterales bacterium]|nr:MAG: antibiotic biosynthesis monooxygenase [Desulfobacterales bacterium]
MAIKVLIKRKIKEGHLRDASKLLIKARYGAMEQNGYISSETLSSLDDPNKILVISMWQKIEDWQGWKNSPVRQANEAEFEKLLNAPTEYETFELGLPFG